MPDALSRREQDIPQDQEDLRLAERQRTLLPAALWNKTAKDNKQTTLVPVALQANVSIVDLNPPVTQPFLEDSHIQDLWNQATRDSNAWDEYTTARNAVTQGLRMFPKCEDELGLLHQKGR